MSDTITLRVRRSEDGRLDEFTVPVQKWTTVLECILYAKQYMDHSIAVRYSCRQATCGSCGMRVNGRPSLACFTKVSEIDSDIITVEPMSNFPIIRDLVVGFEKLFENHRRMQPYLEPEDTQTDRECLQSPQELDRYIQFANCIKCGLCNSACPTMATDGSFLGPQALAQAYRYTADSRDKAKDKRLRMVDDSHGIWRCHFAGSCSQVCPKGVDPAMGIQLLRGYMLGFR